MERQTEVENQLTRRSWVQEQRNVIKRSEKVKNLNHNIDKKNPKNVGHRMQIQSKAVCQELVEETWSSHRRKLGKRRRTCVAGEVD